MWGGSNNGHLKRKFKIDMLEKKFRNQKRQLSVFNTADKPSSYNKELDGSDKKYGNRNNSTLNRQEKSKRSKKA